MSSPLEKLFRLFKGRRNFRSFPVSCLVTVLLLLYSFGCGGVLNNLSEIAQLRNQLIKEYPEQNIDLVLQNSTVLQITFVNSPLNEGPPGQRAMRAQETALFVKRHYPGIGRLERISVSFMKMETRMFIIHYTQQIDGFVFGRDASLVGAPPEYDPQSAFKGESDVIATYNASRNESEVRIPRLQLEGDVDSGLVLTPHFRVRGDATTAGRTVGVPSAVIFNFASYAPERVFKGDQPLRIVADGNTIYSDKARNMSESSASGNDFLAQAVPLAQFLKMTEAKTVILGLGNKEFLLSEKQLRGLQEMAEYATESRRH